MKLISWNVNGIRAIAKKGFSESLLAFDADIICLQETKVLLEQLDQEIIRRFPATGVIFTAPIEKGIQVRPSTQG